MTAMTAIATSAKVTGRRRPAAEVAHRVAFVRQLVTECGRDRARIHEGYRAFYGDDDASARTIDEYLARVDREYIRQAEEKAPDERQGFLAKLDADLALYASAKAWGPHSSARRLQARVLGLDAQQVALSGSVHLTAGRAPAAEDLSPGELAELAAFAASAQLGPPLVVDAEDHTDCTTRGERTEAGEHTERAIAVAAEHRP